MDRELSVKTQRRSQLKTFSRMGLLALALVLGVAGLRMWLKPSLRKTELRTAVAARGSLEASLTASGSTPRNRRAHHQPPPGPHPPGLAAAW